MSSAVPKSDFKRKTYMMLSKERGAAVCYQKLVTDIKMALGT